jgi:group I intron endonuclease
VKKYIYQEMGKIYILSSPSGKSYIGQTTRPIQKRLEEHRTGKSRCVAIYNAIKLHGWENFEIDWYECPDEDLNFDEELMIREMETLAPGGYNLKGGGNNGKPSDETKQKISEAKLGISKSEETKKKMSEAQLGEKNHNFGIPKSEKIKQKMSKAKLGKTGENHPKSKRVYQYALDGTFIGSFGSCDEAGRYLNKTSGTDISKCALGKCKTAYKFKWSYDMIWTY